MAEVIIIADDLTGAADSAAACAAHRLGAMVALHTPGSFIGADCQILSVDANTRCMSVEQAAAVTAQVVRECHASGALRPGSLVFKKLDSTLRGHFAAELDALLSARNATAPGSVQHCVVMAPALPAQGRSTIGGRQTLRGRPVDERDITAQLGDAGLACRLVDLAVIRGDGPGLQRSMTTLSEQADVLLCDAESDDDLRCIAEASMVLRDRAVWAGSAGLAAHLPQAAGIPATVCDHEATASISLPILFAVGSISPVSRAQITRLSGLPDVTTLHLSAESLLNSAVEMAPVIEALQSKRDVLFALDDEQRCSEKDSMLLTRAVARLLGSCAPMVGALVAAGGETARALLDEFGIRRLRLLGEVEPGVPFSIADGRERPLPIITKAGGFGSPGTLIHCRDFLHALGGLSPGVRAASTPVS